MFQQCFMNGVYAACTVCGFALVMVAAVLMFCAIVMILGLIVGEPKEHNND